MTIKGRADWEGLRRAGRAVAKARDAMAAAIEEGMTTAELDALGASILEAEGAVSAPSSVYGFPGATCISLNDEVAHGIPGPRKIRKGDLVNLDVSASLGGYFADTGATVAFGVDDPRLLRLCACSRRALDRALAKARPGASVRDLGAAILAEARADGFTVIRNLCGHGTGAKLHEDPQIPNYPDPAFRARLHAGQVVAVETFVSTGAEVAEEAGDGWTLRTPDGSFTAQYEHTVVITPAGPEILTRV